VEGFSRYCSSGRHLRSLLRKLTSGKPQTAHRRLWRVEAALAYVREFYQVPRVQRKCKLLTIIFLTKQLTGKRTRYESKVEIAANKKTDFRLTL
jgi:hypothetical protein